MKRQAFKVITREKVLSKAQETPPDLEWPNGWQGKQIGGFLVGDRIACSKCTTKEETEAARFRPESILVDAHGHTLGKNRFLYTCERCGQMIAIEREITGRPAMTIVEASAYTQRFIDDPIREGEALEAYRKRILGLESH